MNIYLGVVISQVGGHIPTKPYDTKVVGFWKLKMEKTVIHRSICVGIVPNYSIPLPQRLCSSNCRIVAGCISTVCVFPL